MRVLLTGLVWLLLGCTVFADVTLDGYMKVSGQPRFLLTTEEGKRSDWLSLKQSFAGFVLQSFDEKQGTLLVEKAGVSQRLQLSPGKVGVQVAADDPKVPADRVTLSLGSVEIILEPGNRVQMEELRRKFAELAKQQPPPSVLIKAGIKASAKDVAAAMDLCRVSGLTRFSLQTK